MILNFLLLKKNNIDTIKLHLYNQDNKKKMIRLLTFALLIFINLNVDCQNFDQFFPKFYKNGKQLTLGAIGALRNPQFSNIDFNNDGVKDIFVFDRTGAKVLCFINKSTPDELAYEYAPQYESAFPKLNTWALLHDYNKDGIEDIFCNPVDLAIGNIQVYKGSRVNGALRFDLVRLPFFNTMSEILPNGSQVNLYNALTDIPAIIDVDNDGDTDVISFDSDGAKIIFYENLSKQRGFGLDSFIMVAKDKCFGKIYESQFSAKVFLSPDGLDCASGNFGGGTIEPRHSGSTIVAFDEGCDGDKDLILGDISNNNIVFLRNTGTITNSWVTYQDIEYPPNSTPVNILFFNAVFLLDVNNDNKTDMIVSPNENDGGQSNNQIWLYLNEGDNCNPKYKLHTKNFLNDDIVNNGSKSNICTIDINGDGLEDLLITSSGFSDENNSKKNNVLYYKNTGSKKVPEFTLENENYLNMPSLLTFSVSLSAASGDLDADGDIDLIVNSENGDIFYYENIAGPNKPIVFANYVFPLIVTPTSLGNDLKFHMYDVDGDGLNDLIAGENNYSLNYFKNYSTKGQFPIFKATPETDDFGHVFKSFNFQNYYNSPTMVKNYDGQELAFIGFEDGRISYYERKKTDTADSLKLIANNFGKIFQGSKSTPEIIDIDHNGYFDLIVGSFRGGLAFYHTSIISDKTVSNLDIPSYDFKIYPNPAGEKLTIDYDGKFQYFILNSLGADIKSEALNGAATIDIAGLPQGFYSIFLKSDLSGFTQSKSFIKL